MADVISLRPPSNVSRVFKSPALPVGLEQLPWPLVRADASRLIGDDLRTELCGGREVAELIPGYWESDAFFIELATDFEPIEGTSIRPGCLHAVIPEAPFDVGDCVLVFWYGRLLVLRMAFRNACPALLSIDKRQCQQTLFLDQRRGGWTIFGLVLPIDEFYLLSKPWFTEA